MLFLLPPAPVFAGDAAVCWSYEARPGLFEWTQPPSTACRAGKTVTGAQAEAPADPPAPGTSTVHDAPGVVAVWFSGEVHIGFAARF